ncbi:MAG: hypothetical protein V1685_05370 [Parcubacteria group bacterium]
MPNRNKIVVIIVIIVILLLASGWWWFFYRTGDETNTNGKTNTNTVVTNAIGLQVEPTVQSEGVTKDLTTTGGEISLDLANNKAVLTVPEDALTTLTSLGMKEINSITGMPAGFEFLSGIEISPDGTQLERPATLTFDIPQDQASQKLIGFAYSSGGEDFQLFPLKINGAKVTLQLVGFSGHGILVLKDDQATPPEPSTIEKQAKQNIARIAAEGAGIDEGQQNRIKNILRGWYNTSVKVNLAAAKTNADKFEAAFREFFSWKWMAEFFQLDGSFQAEIEQSYDDIAAAIKNASSKAFKDCQELQDPNKATKLFRYLKIIDLLGLDGRAGLDKEAIAEMAEKCLVFELNITIGDAYGSPEGMSEVDGEGSGSIAFQDNLKLSGSAEVTITRNQTVGLLPCTSNVPETYTVNIPEFSLATSTSGNNFSLLIELGSAPADLVWECGASARQYDPEATITDPNPAWMFDFLHEDERVEIKGDFASYLLKGWEIVNDKGVFARKVYNRTKNNPFGLGATFKENLTLELIHKPKR